MYLPVVSLNRGQQVRLGNAFPDQLGRTKQTGNDGTRVFHATHVSLAQGNARRDLQRHSAIGSYEVVGAVTSKWSDLFAPSGGTVSAGSGNSVNVSAFSLQSRLFPDQFPLSVAAVTNLATPSFASNDVYYLIKVDEYGNVTAVPGSQSTGAPTYEVDTVTITGTPTGGTFTLSFTYNGFNYVTAGIAYNAAASAVASAVLAATGVGSTTAPALPTSTLTGSGGALPGAAVTLTASGALEGPITNQSINISGLTGGTPGGSFVSTTAGSGNATLPPFDGSSLPLASVFVAAGASAPSKITSLVLTS